MSQANNLKSKTSNPKTTILGHATKTKPKDPSLIGLGHQPGLIPIIINPTSNPKSVAQILPNKICPQPIHYLKPKTHYSYKSKLSTHESKTWNFHLVENYQKPNPNKTPIGLALNSLASGCPSQYSLVMGLESKVLGQLPCIHKSYTRYNLSPSLSLSLSLSYIYKEGFCPNKRKKQVKVQKTLT